jgi:hypothetical protein
MRATVAQNAHVHKSRTCIDLPMEEQPQRQLPNGTRSKSIRLPLVAFLAPVGGIKGNMGLFVRTGYVS